VVTCELPQSMAPRRRRHPLPRHIVHPAWRVALVVVRTTGRGRRLERVVGSRPVHGVPARPELSPGIAGPTMLRSKAAEFQRRKVGERPWVDPSLSSGSLLRLS